MTDTKPTGTVRRGRIFPDIQWSDEKRATWKAEKAAFHQRSKVIFDQVQPELIKTHYNWYMAVEPDSGDYFIDRDVEVATQMARQKHPNVIPFVFRINETGTSGTI